MRTYTETDSIAKTDSQTVVQLKGNDDELIVLHRRNYELLDKQELPHAVELKDGDDVTLLGATISLDLDIAEFVNSSDKPMMLTDLRLKEM